MAFMAITRGLGLLFYILLGLRYGLPWPNFPQTKAISDQKNICWAWCSIVGLGDEGQLKLS